MKKINSRIVGAAGEYYVLSQLLRRGWIAALAPDGAPNMDILVTDENNDKLCAIQVKTRRDTGGDKGWHMRRKHETMIADDLFYVFVDVGKQPSDPSAPWKGAFSWWVRIPPSSCRFRLVAAGAVRGGNDMD